MWDTDHVIKLVELIELEIVSLKATNTRTFKNSCTFPKKMKYWSFSLVVSDFWTPLYIKYSIIIFVVGADPLFLTCLVSLQNPQISLNSLTSALPFLSLFLPPPIHSFRQCVWNMIALVIISGAFTLGIALCSTQYSDWNVGLKYSVQHSQTHNNTHSFVHLFSPAHTLGPSLLTNPLL